MSQYRQLCNHSRWTHGTCDRKHQNPNCTNLHRGFITPGKALSVVVSGIYANVARCQRSCNSEYRNPAFPVRAPLYCYWRSCNDVFCSRKLAYTAFGISGLGNSEYNTPSAPTRAGFYDVAGYTSGVAYSGNYAYLAYGIWALRMDIQICS
jgi:hypothetical protein